jgi:hypothetical protein
MSRQHVQELQERFMLKGAPEKKDGLLSDGFNVHDGRDIRSHHIADSGLSNRKDRHRDPNDRQRPKKQATLSQERRREPAGNFEPLQLRAFPALCTNPWESNPFPSLSKTNSSSPRHFRRKGLHVDVFGMGKALRTGSADLQAPSEGDAEVVFRDVIQAVLSPKVSAAASVLGKSKLSGLTGAFDQFKPNFLCGVLSFFCHRLDPFLTPLRSVDSPLRALVSSRFCLAKRKSSIFVLIRNLSDESFTNLSCTLQF